MSVLLSAKRLTKQIAEHADLREVNLEISSGEVVGLIGRNDERRKRLLRILCGLERADEGELLWMGNVVGWKSENEARQAGILRLNEVAEVGDKRTVSAWMWEGREPRWWGFKRHDQMRRDTREFLDDWGFKADEKSVIGDLKLVQRQRLALLRAAMARPKLLVIEDGVLDWPMLEGQKLAEFFDRLREDEVGVVIEAGSLNGLTEVTDRAVILREGRNVGQMFQHELDDEEQLLRLMGGAAAEKWLMRAPLPRKKGWVVVDVQGLCTKQHPQRVFGFDLSQGEIVGLTGNEDSGKHEVFKVLCGMESPAKGTILVAGEKAKLRSMNDALEAGFLMLPAETRLREKVLYQARGLKRNANRGVWLHGSMIKSDLDRLAELIWMRGPGREVEKNEDREWVRTLANWLGLGPGVMLLEEPTTGMDELTKREWFHLMEKVVLGGMAVLIVSRDFELLTGFSHRTLVMHEGDLVGILQGERLTKQAILSYAAGGGRKWLPVHR